MFSFCLEIEKGFACDANELHGLASGASAASKDKGQRGFLGAWVWGWRAGQIVCVCRYTIKALCLPTQAGVKQLLQIILLIIITIIIIIIIIIVIIIIIIIVSASD